MSNMTASRVGTLRSGVGGASGVLQFFSGLGVELEWSVHQNISHGVEWEWSGYENISPGVEWEWSSYISGVEAGVEHSKKPLHPIFYDKNR